MKRTIPQIREDVKAITAALRVSDPSSTDYLLALDDIDRAMDETRRSDFGKPKPKKKPDPIMRAIDLG